MKKILTAFCLSLFLSVAAFGGESKKLFSVAGVDVLFPTVPDAVYLFDLQTDTSLGGVEGDVLHYKDLAGTVGVVTEGEGNGIPYVGLDYKVGNLLGLENVRVGGFYFRDFDNGSNHAGVKATVDLFSIIKGLVN